MSDHMTPYAPDPEFGRRLVELYGGTVEQARLRIVEALRIASPILVVGPPTRVLMRPDPNPFPTFRLWGARGR